ncbi:MULTISPECIES: DUF1993 domain-containing protein [Sorangium]|uniref:DUF1993 domain-containing protein n=1 Tax=Sorangium cellulosum (strain So ce56) TaxID=448385 RepID=A9EUM9_SORC5|nr:DUF1993 domain-containing protein [Sorangium cellulosum]CAN91114.1 hypothetical protein sce0957 [Sorangium cellulosum So ce56]
MSLYDSSFPQMTRMLGQVLVWLDKAEAYAQKKKFDPEVLLAARLAPDQWNLRRQIQNVIAWPLRLGALLTGAELPQLETGDETIAELRARIGKAIEQVKAVKPEQLKGAEDRTIPLFFLPGKGMKAPEFVFGFALPNFYFHATTAYSILRHNGLDVGKSDFIGSLDLRDL